LNFVASVGECDLLFVFKQNNLGMTFELVSVIFSNKFA